MSTFVSVGNAKQHFNRLLDAVGAIIDLLHQPVIVQHGHTLFINNKCQKFEFMSMEQFEYETARAQILIFHAGAGCILHALKTGKKPIVMPRRARHGEHVNDHQHEFALELSNMGKVILVEDSESLKRAVVGFENNMLKLNSQKENIMLGLIRAEIDRISQKSDFQY